MHRHHYLLFFFLFIFSVEEKRVEKNKQANRGNRCIFILYKNFMCAFFLSLFVWLVFLSLIFCSSFFFLVFLLSERATKEFGKKVAKALIFSKLSY